MPNILEKVREQLRNKPKANADAIKWFRKTIFSLGSGHGTGSHAARTSERSFRRELLGLNDLMQDEAEIGLLFLFVYDPKYKKTLPYYDKFPLVFPVEWSKDAFMGINLHYLPYRERLILFTNLLKYKNTKNMTNGTKLKLSYQLLKQAGSLRAFKPCLKKYLPDHVQSRMIRIPSADWETAIFLPVENFEKKPKTYVWQDSLEKIDRGMKRNKEV